MHGDWKRRGLSRGGRRLVRLRSQARDDGGRRAVSRRDGDPDAGVSRPGTLSARRAPSRVSPVRSRTTSSRRSSSRSRSGARCSSAPSGFAAPGRDVDRRPRGAAQRSPPSSTVSCACSWCACSRSSGRCSTPGSSRTPHVVGVAARSRRGGDRAVRARVRRARLPDAVASPGQADKEPNGGVTPRPVVPVHHDSRRFRGEDTAMTRLLRSLAGTRIGGLPVLDLAVAVFLAVYAVALTSGAIPTGHPHGALGASIGVLAMTLPVAWCRRAPVAAAAVLAFGAVLNSVLFGSMVRCGAALPAVLIVAFFVSARSDRARAGVGIAFCAINVTAQAVSDPQLGAQQVALLLPVLGMFVVFGRMRSRPDGGERGPPSAHSGAASPTRGDRTSHGDGRPGSGHHGSRRRAAQPDRADCRGRNRRS